MDLMQQVIKENPDELDAYINMNFLIMNLLDEENYDTKKHDDYKNLLKGYFTNSYEKFADNAEYLFYTGMTAVMSEWYFDETYDVSHTMLRNATMFEPDSMQYKWGYYGTFPYAKYAQESYLYAKEMLSDNSPIKELLLSKGAVGDFILMIMDGCLKRNSN